MGEFFHLRFIDSQYLVNLWGHGTFDRKRDLPLRFGGVWVVFFLPYTVIWREKHQYTDLWRFWRVTDTFGLLLIEDPSMLGNTDSRISCVAVNFNLASIVCSFSSRSSGPFIVPVARCNACETAWHRWY